MATQQNEYQANDADAIVGEIFSGGITVAEAIERLRTRLLDLSVLIHFQSWAISGRIHVEI